MNGIEKIPAMSNVYGGDILLMEADSSRQLPIDERADSRDY